MKAITPSSLFDYFYCDPKDILCYATHGEYSTPPRLLSLIQSLGSYTNGYSALAVASTVGVGTYYLLNYLGNVPEIETSSIYRALGNNKAKKAVLIGINYTGTDNELYGCANDVRDMKNLLLNSGFQNNDIITLSDEIPHAIYPSRRNILTQLENLVTNARAGDELVIHFSGHGTQKENFDGTESDGFDEAICPASGAIILDDELKRIINRVPVGATLFAIFDCCHSGTILDLKHNLVHSPNRHALQNHGYTVMISGCKDDQYSSDASFLTENYQWRNQGALTTAFIEMVNRYNGFSNVMKACFSNSRAKLHTFQNELKMWLNGNGFFQTPNIAYEGTLPPVLNYYQHRVRNDRNTDLAPSSEIQTPMQVVRGTLNRPSLNM